MATKHSKQLTEAELNNPDLDDEGNLDVEHYPIPDGSNIEDGYLKEVWNAAVSSIDVDDDEECDEEDEECDDEIDSPEEE